MQTQPFIFSNERKYRILRHVAFWAFWWVIQGFLYSHSPSLSSADFIVRFSIATMESLIYLFCHIFLAYSLMYFVIPRFLLKQRYWLTIIWTAILFFATASISAFLSMFIIDPIRVFVNAKINGLVRYVPSESVYYAILAGLRGGLTIGGLAAAIKLMKYWYVKEQHNLQLQKENVESQLLILKAQVHPHFLFNTLNNLYSLALIHSDKTPVVVTHLSDLLRYMLYECNEKEVPLEKEIEALKKYVELEKLRYGDRIDVSFTCSGDINKNVIAPLILLPFVENSFKHGVSDQLDQCWISLHLHAERDQFTFNLSNSSTNGKLRSAGGGIGLQNIRKRLELMYAGKYNLTITEEGEMYVVKLQMQLSPGNRPENAASQIIIHQPPVSV